MGHYAFINTNNIVTEVITGRDEDEAVGGITDWEAYYATQREGMRCLRTSYNTRGGVYYNPETGKPVKDQTKAFRLNYAGQGYTYDEKLDGFIPPKPYPSWKLNTKTGLWDAPVKMPTKGGPYTWDEDAQSWVEYSDE